MADKAVEEQRYSSVFADNECAQALLELAKSPPVNGVMKPMLELFSQESQTTASSSLFLNGAGDDDMKKAKEGKSSILKRQLEESECVKKLPRTLDNYDPKIVVKIECQSKEELRKELVKRIRLDHGYAQGEAASVKNRRSWPEVRQSTVKCPTRRFHSWKSVPTSVTPSPHGGQDVGMDTKFRDDNKYGVMPTCTTVAERANTEPTSLCDGVDMVAKRINTSDEDAGQLLTADGKRYQCPFCHRSHQQKCYILKHIKHVHGAHTEEPQKNLNGSVCQRCGTTVLWEDLKQHLKQCSQHTQKSRMQLKDGENSGLIMCSEDSDSDSSTLSGTDHEEEDGDGDMTDTAHHSYSTDISLHEPTADVYDTSTVLPSTAQMATSLSKLSSSISANNQLQRLTNHTELSLCGEAQHDSSSEMPSSSVPIACSPDSHPLLQESSSEAGKRVHSAELNTKSQDNDCHSSAKPSLLFGQNNIELCLTSNNNCPVPPDAAHPELQNTTCTVYISKENDIRNIIPVPSLTVVSSLRTNIVPRT